MFVVTIPLNNLFFMIAFLVGVATPLRASGVALQQSALGLALIAAFVVVSRNPGVRERIKAALASRPGRGALVVFAAWAVSVLFSPDVPRSLEIGGRSGLFLLACVIVWAVLSESAQTHRLLWKSLVASAVLLSGLTTLALLDVPYLSQMLSGKFGQDFRPELQFKAYAAAAMCLIPVVAWAGRRLEGSWRWWGYAYVPLALAVMVLTYNRAALAGFLAMALSGILLLALARHRHAKALLVTVLAGGAGIVAWIAARETDQFNTIATHDTLETYLPYWLLDPHRQNIWKFAFEHFLDHPWVGNGIDQLNKLPGASQPVPGLDQSAAMVPSHPHNWALEVLAETGVIGFIPTVAVLGLVAIIIARRYIRLENEADLALFTLMAGFWASALFNFSIWAVWWQLTFYMLFAIISATRSSAPTSDLPGPPG